MKLKEQRQITSPSDNEIRLRKIFESSSNAIIEISMGGLMLDWNHRAEIVFGWKSNEILSKSFSEMLVPARLREEQKKTFSDFFQTTHEDFTIKTNELFLSHRDGREFPAEISLAILCHNHKKGLIAFIRDVTERKRIESEVLNVSIREQQRIGQDLHDSICQELTGTAFVAKVLEQSLLKKNLPDANDAKKIVAFINEALNQTRGLARGLLAWEIETNGLHASLKELAANMGKLFKVNCKVKYSPFVKIRNTMTAKHLYRIAQEAIGNAIKHGKAKNVSIEMSKEDGQAILKITDDGTSFSIPWNESKGMGLRIMKYRASSLGGNLLIEPKEGQGTIIKCSFVPE